MEKTYHYQITHDGAVLAAGEQTLDLGVLTPNLHKSGYWSDVLRELSDKARLAIKVGGDWYHPDDDNFSPFEDEEEVIDVQGNSEEDFLILAKCPDSTPRVFR